MSRTFLIVGGGTGGHIFPGLAVAEELRSMGHDVHWLGARRGLENTIVGERGYPLTLVDIEGLRGRSASAAARVLTQLPLAVTAAARAVLRVCPAAVLGVGGYASGAGLLAAGLLGVPFVLQEQNSVPGWTNRVFSPWADGICCGFEEAIRCFQSLPAEWTGNPVRSEFFDTPDLRRHDPPRLLVLGGSQGSLFINRILPQALAVLSACGVSFEVTHQAGGRWTDIVKTAYSDLLIQAEVVTFLAQPWRALADADLVVSRAGALTVSELAAAGRGAVFIPFRRAVGNHQHHNARSLERAGAAVTIGESEATPARLAAVLEELLTDPDALERLGRSARAQALPDVGRRIAERLIAVGGGS